MSEMTDGQKIARAYAESRKRNPPPKCCGCSATVSLWWSDEWEDYFCNPCAAERGRQAAYEDAARIVMDGDGWEWSEFEECLDYDETITVDKNATLDAIATAIRARQQDEHARGGP